MAKEKGNGKGNGTTAVATRQGGGQVATLRSMLEKAKSQIEMALPRHLTPERMIRVALTTVQRSQMLMKCDPLSIVGAIVEASQLGLEPDGILGHAYLVPFWNKKTGRHEAQLIPGYRGYIELARRSGHVASLQAHVVYSADEFTFEYGLDEKLVHKPNMGEDRGKPVCAYAVARLKDGGHQIDVMSVKQIEDVRKRSKAADSGPWVTDWDEMARKTVVRRLVKYLPLSPELQKAAALDDHAEVGIPHQMDIEVESAEAVAEATAQRQAALREKYAGEQPAEIVDEETGEVTEEPAREAQKAESEEDADLKAAAEALGDQGDLY